MRKRLITKGRCSACGRPAELSRTGGWVHAEGSGCGSDDAWFEAVAWTDVDTEDGPGGEGRERQQQPPRNRMITDPGRDR
jgi:hypothetical protein